MKTYSIRDLRDRSGELSCEAEQGNIAIITKHGRPLMVSVPFEKAVVESGVHVALAVNLYKSGGLSLGLASRVARQSVAAFSALLSDLGIAVVDYPVSDLAQELEEF